MTMVVTLPCIGCKDASCAKACPMECFHEGETMLFINPELCIECEACISECPSEAIFQQDEIPMEWTEYIQLNAEQSQRLPLAET